MNGVAHYKAAEKLIEIIERRGEHENGDPIVSGSPDSDDSAIIALAQAHATLALADYTAGIYDNSRSL